MRLPVRPILLSSNRATLMEQLINPILLLLTVLLCEQHNVTNVRVLLHPNN